jgi:cystathionine gamma-synthase
VASAAGSPVLVDNTFASPALQQPLALGATLSLSSTTKYINGHSDCLGGVVACNDPAWQERMLFAQKALGLQPAPFDSWLTARGVRTLSMRMERHCANALTVAEHLEAHPRVTMVRYPFLKSHPQYDLATRQMRGGSGIVICELDADVEATLAVAKRLQLFTLAESLGGIESLICHPASMTHASVPPEVRQGVGISDGLLRLSIGCEDATDLLADLNAALDGLP